jgi:hypothetical protein
MDSLRTAVEEHAFWLIALPKEPLFDSMRGTRQFESRCKWDLVKREEVIRQGLRLADFIFGKVILSASVYESWQQTPALPLAP